jgi:type IV pilus assembly protein PilW
MSTRAFAAPPRPQRGFTLIELMVGLTLGLVVITALLLLFANASSRGQDLARTSIQIENGRYVAEMLREDLRLAGFFGETSVTGATYSQPDPCSTTPTGWNGTPTSFGLPTPVQGYGPTDVLACLDHRKAGTDAIAIRRVGVTAVDPATLAGGNTQHYVQYSYCVTDVASPRLVFSANRSDFTLRNRACSGVNLVRPYVSRIYYISDCNQCGAGGDTLPTLKRVELVAGQLTTTALAEGIEMLRLEYGFDVDGDGSPDTYLTRPGATGASALWSNVVSLKAHYITRSLDRDPGAALIGAQQFQLGNTAVVSTAADGYARKAYSSAIRLINPSASREVP